MPKIITDMIAYINEFLPNRANSSTINTFIDDEAKRIRRFIPDILDHSTQTVADQQTYNLPNNIRISDIISMYMSATTYNATTLVTSTLDWRKYKFAGYEDRYMGEIYFKATTENSSVNSDRICISPIPDDVVYFKISHWAYPNTSNGTTTIINNDTLVAYLENKVMAKISRMGNHPRIDLSNNFELEAESYLRVLKRERENKELALSSKRIGYKDWWD